MLFVGLSDFALAERFRGVRNRAVLPVMGLISLVVWQVHRAKVEAAEALERNLAATEAPEWPEIAAVIQETRRE